jgi:hypothetical protein
MIRIRKTSTGSLKWDSKTTCLRKTSTATEMALSFRRLGKKTSLRKKITATGVCDFEFQEVG